MKDLSTKDVIVGLVVYVVVATLYKSVQVGGNIGTYIGSVVYDNSVIVIMILIVIYATRISRPVVKKYVKI